MLQIFIEQGLASSGKLIFTVLYKCFYEKFWYTCNKGHEKFNFLTFFEFLSWWIDIINHSKEVREHIAALKQTGRTNAEIIAHVQERFQITVNRRMINRTMKRLNATGSMDELPPSGRPKKCTVRETRVLRRIAIQDRLSSLRALIGRFLTDQNQKVSHETAPHLT